MRVALRSLLVCVLGCMLGGSLLGEVALGSETTSSSGISSPLGDPLVIPAEEELVGDQTGEVEAVKRDNPEAVAARGASSSAYEGLGSQAAEKVADEAFAGVIAEPSGGPPRLPAGQKIVSFLSANAASLELPGGLKGVVYSEAPIAAEGSGGRYVPIDLSLTQSADGGWEPKVPVAGIQVLIPKRLADGPSLATSGVGLIPVNEQGVALGGAEGVEDGASVFYGDTEALGVTDVDTVVKPNILGLSTETILRSQRSPERLFFRVSLPSGASLVADHSGGADVVYAGQVIAMVLPAKARDAEGTEVPVSSSVSGDMLVLKVEHQPGEYRMPIDVDPIVSEGQSMGRYQMGRGWWFSANSPGGVFTNYEPKDGIDGMEDHDPYSNHYKTGEYGLFGYETKGESRIDEFVSESYDNNPATISSTVYIGGPGGLESAVHAAESTPTTVCVTEGCTAPVGSSSHWANGVFYKQSALAEEYGSFEDLLRSATVYIMQEKAPSVTSLGSCGSTWTNISVCGVEWSAFDPGIGVNEFALSSPSASGWGITEKYYCEGGVQCLEHASGRVSLTGLPEGEDTIKATVKDPVGLGGGPTERIVKIDNVAPHGIASSGLPAANEIGAGEYHLKAEATDGVSGTVSSGVKSIMLLIDGRSVGSPSGSCSVSLGPCTAHGEWTIAGREYGTGHHTITVIATDNAGNTAQETYPMIVHAPTPVAAGPGQVNPQSGEFALSATDVSMGGGLTVGRSYRSRHLTTGTEGPLSAQWGFSLGGNETLAKQPDGSMLLTDSGGAQTNFAPDGKGGFISPAGDANLMLSSNPCVVGQIEYMLSDTAAKTTTCFKSPSGSGEVLLPSVTEGAVATDTVSYSYEVEKTSEYALPKESQPRGIVRGPDGNLWFTDYRTSRIGKITTSGAVTEYRVPEGSEPDGITSGPDGNLWFTDLRTSKIGKITTSGAITEYSLPASSYPVEITTGPDKNLWITEEYTNKIVKMTTAGAATEYSLPAGSGPEGITSGPDGNLWFVDREKSKVAKMTTSGIVTEYSLPAESYPEGIVTGPDKNLWFTEWSNKIGKITTAGVITEYALPTEARPHHITVGPDENLWFTEANARIGKITTTGAVSEFSVPSESSPAGIAAGPDGYVWYADESSSKIAKTLPLNAPDQPVEALGPVPAGVSCSPELKPGCRALSFNYATTTTATPGENSSQWGSYSGHLSGVSYTAYDPISKGMKTLEVAHYLYDSQGRLRAEWDPRISPALKTTYGYDSEGHVTALTMPGQESWAFAYGTITNDSGAGRLLKTDQATASTALWNGEATKYTEVPKLSGEAFVGTRMTVSDGLWTPTPVLYGYQWEDCNSSGTGCVAIPGATNANYTPVSSDEGHKLVAQVTAINGDGAVSPSSVASAVVKSGHGTEGPVRGAQPGTTIEYGVALSGTGLPTMTKAEVEKWGQKDFPTEAEATAVFPPDEPQAWPASDYKRATIYYRDSTSRTVNVATPGGGVSTDEYNEQNDVTRSLSADNRAAAMKEGAKSAEVAQTLDTQSTYSTDGTELLSTLGPQHTVKLAAGREVQARSHTVYTYDEGAPSEGGPYRLVTKMTQGAEFTGKEEDVRTTITYYSGQNGLGWKLRKPTSTVTDPNGLDLVHSTVYNETTGGVIETQTPNGNRESASALESFHSFGGSGSGSGQLSGPLGVATDSSGDVWVADTGHDRVQEFNSKGEFVREFGAEGSGNGQFIEPRAIAVSAGGYVYVVDSGNSRVQEFNSKGEFVRAFGAGGSGNGQFGKLRGIAVDGEGHVWTVEAGVEPLGQKTRVQEFSSEGVYIGQFGKEGTGNGQFKGPQGIVLDSKGDVWVADTTNNRVQELKPNGEFLRAFGTEGVGNGQFKKPAGLSFDGEGDLWVADAGNDRIQRFTSEGSYLSQVGKAGNENDQFNKPEDITTSSAGNVWVADTNNNRVQELTGSEFVLKFGGSGSGSGQLSGPLGVATDSSGDVWVADTGHDRVQEFNSKGEFVREFGAEGSGNGQFSEPRAIAVSAGGYVYVVDSGNSRVQEFNSKGEFVREFGAGGSGNGQFGKLRGIAVDGEGHVWTVEAGVEPLGQKTRVQEFSSEGVYIGQFGKEGTGNGQFKGPQGIVLDSKGDVWVADTTNNRVQELKPNGEFLRAFGTEGVGNGQFKKPAGLSFDGEGDLWVADAGNDRIQRFTSEGSYLSQVGKAGNENDQFNKPEDITTSSAGNVWVADTNNNRVQELTGSEFVLKFGGSGSGSGQLSGPLGVATDSSGDVWVADTGHDRVQEFNSKGEFVREFGAEGSGNGQFSEPRAIAVSAGGYVYVVDSGNSRVQEFNSKGEFVREFGAGGSGNGQFGKLRGIAVDGEGHVWTVEAGVEPLGQKTRVQEFSSEGVYIGQFGKEGTGNGQFKGPQGIVLDSKGDVWVADTTNNRVQELKPNGEFLRAFGTEGVGNGQFKKPAGLSFDGEGDLWVADAGNDRIQRFTSEGSYLSQVGKAGNENDQFNKPEDITTSSAGNVWVADTNNNRVQIWKPELQLGADTKTIYYTASNEAETEACQNHPEWAMLPCITEPTAQPKTAGLPELPVTTTTYNMYQEPFTSTSTSGSSKRTITNTYEESGRLATTETIASTGTALPKVSDKYSETTGQLTEQSTSSQSIKSAFNTLGELTSYTDADGNISTFEYEPEKDARLKKINDGKGIQTLIYDEASGLVKELVDSSAGTFTAGYDIEGNLTSETYPNGMAAKYTLNPTGERVGLVYKKETHCTEKCEWYVDNVVPSIHGQWLTQNTSFNKDNYTYDAAGRLTESQVTPAGSGGCMTRRYGYDEETNRTSLMTYQPNAKNECATETGTIERHVYDGADRLSDSGVGYDPFGDTTSLPAGDAGGSALTSSFYVDNQLANQTQAGETIGYNLDPAGRTREIVSTGKIVASEIQHYASPGDTPAWTAETSGNWTRKISTMTGLSAIEHNGEAPILQLTNLHGDIVATAQDSETATGLASTIKEASDYGVPATETPPKYSWLGSHEIATELPSGITQMGARSYVPQLGRFLQTDPRPGGSANAYAYVFGDPINSNDLTGESATGPSAWALGLASELSNQETAAYEAALRAEAERKAREAAEAARAYAAMQGASPEGEYYEEEGPEEEWWEEEGEEWEYVSYKHSGKPGNGEAHTEQALLVQPLEEQATSETQTRTDVMARLCQSTSREESSRVHCTRYASVGSWIKKNIIRPAEHAWNTTVRYISRGVTDTYKATGANLKGMWEVGKSAYEDWNDAGEPVP